LVKVAIIGNGVWGSKIENCIKDGVQFVEPSKAEWIIIATPNDLHYEQAENWLGKRKNVFCEKPLTLTTKTSEMLFSLADFMSVKLYVDDVFTWYDNLDIDVSRTVDFKWYKHGSFNANIIDNLAYHHFYLWLDNKEFEVDEIQKKYYTPYTMNILITLKDGRRASFDYNILSKVNKRTINGVEVNSVNNPLRDMLLAVFDKKVDFDSNRKRTLNAIKLCESVKKEICEDVLVVGGGIFGTTAAIMLATSGYNVTLHEELSSIMKCASNINQYRLHRGYHYPRSRETAKECLDGIKSFKRKYEDSIVNEDANHYYTISSHDSLVTPKQYLEFLDSMGLKYEQVDSFQGTDLTVKVSEDLFDSENLRIQAIEKMKSVGVDVILDRQTIKEDYDDYDIVVIATYAKINELLYEQKSFRPDRQYQFEVVEKPVVKLPESYKNKSVVVMDGPFMCLDPYKEGLHVLGHVKHAIHDTNIGMYPVVSNEDIAEYLNNGVIENPKITNIQKFIDAGMEFFEDFDKLEHIGSMFTIRTVLAYRDYDDARPTYVKKEHDTEIQTDKIYTIFSGKIGTCVNAANELLLKIKEDINYVKT